MMRYGGKNVVGVVGGMGPLASAEFLKTIYECSLGSYEQLAPTVIMVSDPTFPDRTEELLAGLHSVLLDRLIGAMWFLRESGASTIVICCVTIHYLLPQLPIELKEGMISLLDVTFSNIAKLQKKHLLICTNGARKLRLFESHSKWEALKDLIVLPDESDQERIHHDFIYQIKKNKGVRELIPALESLMAKYNVDAFIAGCTETHLLAKHFETSSDNQIGYGSLDPLAIIARTLACEDKSAGQALTSMRVPLNSCTSALG